MTSLPLPRAYYKNMDIVPTTKDHPPLNAYVHHVPRVKQDCQRPHAPLAVPRVEGSLVLSFPDIYAGHIHQHVQANRAEARDVG